MSEKYLNKIIEVTVDRPLGTKHPKYDLIYPANYGYIKGTLSGDGEELDAYILDVKSPLVKFTGRVIAIIRRLNEDDDKLIVVEDGKNFNDEQIRKLTYFQEKYFDSIILRK